MRIAKEFYELLLLFIVSFLIRATGMEDILAAFIWTSYKEHAFLIAVIALLAVFTYLWNWYICFKNILEWELSVIVYAKYMDSS